jgi:DNA-binding NarL/FixJ family response regulator
LESEQNDTFLTNLKKQKTLSTNPIKLTAREMEVLKYVVMGMSNSEIAKNLIISEHTAKAHVCSILKKMQAKDRVNAAVKAVRAGLF